MKILHLVDPKSAPDALKQVEASTPLFVEDHVVLATTTPIGLAGNRLRSFGMDVREFSRGAGLDLSAWWDLRNLLHADNPDVVHTWGLPALRLLASCSPKRLKRTLASNAVPSRGKLSWIDRLVLSRTARCSCTGLYEHAWMSMLGISPTSLPSVASPLESESSTPSFTLNEFVRPFPQRIVCIAPLDLVHGVRQAIHAVDILNHVHPELHLLIAGEGSAGQNLYDLATGLRNLSRVHFLGDTVDCDDLLKTADLVWIPTMINAGHELALRAMALGKPVLASDVPCLRDVIEHGETGFLIPHGDVVTLSRCSHALLQDEKLRDRIGEAARRFVAANHAPAFVGEKMRRTYQDLAA